MGGGLLFSDGSLTDGTLAIGSGITFFGTGVCGLTFATSCSLAVAPACVKGTTIEERFFDFLALTIPVKRRRKIVATKTIPSSAMLIHKVWSKTKMVVAVAAATTSVISVIKIPLNKVRQYPSTETATSEIPIKLARHPTVPYTMYLLS